MKMGPYINLWNLFCAPLRSFGIFDVNRVSFAVRAPLAMWLGALERGTSHLSPGTEIFENDLLVLILQHETCEPLDLKSGTNQMEDMGSTCYII